LKHISIVAYRNGGLVLIRDMDEFASYFCYTVKVKTVPVNR